MVGMEILVGGWFPRTRHPYKTKGFAPSDSIPYILASVAMTSATNHLGFPISASPPSSSPHPTIPTSNGSVVPL